MLITSGEELPVDELIVVPLNEIFEPAVRTSDKFVNCSVAFSPSTFFNRYVPLEANDGLSNLPVMSVAEAFNVFPLNDILFQAVIEDCLPFSCVCIVSPDMLMSWS